MPEGVAIKSLIKTDAQEAKKDPDPAGDRGPITSELNGRLIRVVKANDLKDYFNYRSSDTGHIVFTVHGVDTLVEYHILIIQGKPVAAYSETSSLCGSALIEALTGVAGTIEYYFIEEPIIRSVLDKFPGIAVVEGNAPAKPMAPAGKKDEEAAGAAPTTPTIPKETATDDEAAMEKPEERADDANAGHHAHTVKATIAELVKSELGSLEPDSTDAPGAGEKGANDGKKIESTSKLDNLLRRLKLVR